MVLPGFPWMFSARLMERDGPPDLEDFFKDMLAGIRRKKPGQAKAGQPAGGSGESGAPSGEGPNFMKPVLLGAAALFVLGWAGLGFFIVGPAERAVVLQFGKYLETVGPGPHWAPPLVETVQKVNVDQVSSVQLSALMLTQEENIVSVQFVAQYRIGNLEDYLFNVVAPVDTLGQSLDSAVRQVIGHSNLNDILTTGRAEIADKVRQQLQQLMAQYQTGIEVVDVTMQPASAPEPVKDAFDDVIKAREDKVRSANEATSYANQVVPVAKGQAIQLLQSAKAGASQSVNNAKADVAAFEALLPQYQMAPALTQTRLYFETLESVFSKTPLIVASDTGKNMIYLSPAGFQPPMKSSEPVAQRSAPSVSPAPVAPTPDAYPRWKQAQVSAAAAQGDNA